MHYFKSFLKILSIFFIFIILTGARINQSESPKEYYEQGISFIEQRKFNEAYNSLSQAWQKDKNNYTYKLWFMRISIFMGENALKVNDHNSALKHFNTAFSIKKELSQTKDTDYLTIERYIELTREHERFYKKAPEHVFKVLALYIKKTDLRDTHDGQGKLVTSKGEISDDQIENTNHKQDILKFYIEALTKGRLSMSFERKVLSTTLTRATIHARQANNTAFRPDFNSTTENLGKILFQGRNTFDAVFYYFNNKSFRVWPFANGVPSIFHPYTLYGSPRGSIGMPMDVSGEIKNALSRFNHAWVHFHEFFHVVERICGGIGPIHGWLADAIEKSKKRYPDWVPDMNSEWTATEYSWYRYHFLNTVPKQMKKKAEKSGIYPIFKNFSFVNTNPDRTDEHAFITYNNALRNISLDNLRKASEIFNPAYKLLRQKKITEAIALYKKILEFNPYHHNALIRLGGIYLQKNDINTANQYYRVYAKVFPDKEQLFSIGISFFKRNEYKLAADYFQVIADRDDASPVYSYWLWKMLKAAGDTINSKKVLPRFSDNPVYKSKANFLTFREINTSLSLYSDSNPESSSVPGVSKIGRGDKDIYKWKIIPSEESDYVIIVSDYTWKCIDVQKNTIIQSRINGNESQKWKLIKGEDGFYHIISKIDGRMLTVTKTERRNKYKIVLQAFNEEASYAWKIQ